MDRSSCETRAARDHREAFLQAVRRYGGLIGEYMALKRQLGELEEHVRDAYFDLQERARAAFADTRTTPEWEELYWTARRVAGDTDVLAGMALPRPQDDSTPPSFRDHAS
jgi:hypothetical protein